MGRRHGEPTRLSLVQLKAYGDLVIALSAIQRIPVSGRDRLEILLGTHLLSLFDAMKVDCQMRVVSHPEQGVPALFDARKQGPWRAATSASRLRQALKQAGELPSSTLLFDRIGIRERILSAGKAAIALPAAPNIYLAYEALMHERGFPMAPVVRPAAVGGLVRIFPGSRLPTKDLPIRLVDGIVGCARESGIRTELMILEGERPDLISKAREFTLLPRRFEDMIEAVRGADLVISADSMPAHVAEYFGRPAFVFSPVANPYWLPRKSFEEGLSARFEEGADAQCFRRFLARAATARNGLEDRPAARSAVMEGYRPDAGVV